MIKQTIKKSIIGGVGFFSTILILSIGYAAITNTWTNTGDLEVSSGSTLSANNWNKLLGNFEVLKQKTNSIYSNGNNIGIGISPSDTSKLKIYQNNVTNAEISRTDGRHYFEAQNAASTNAFEIYVQHGSSTSRGFFNIKSNIGGTGMSHLYVHGDGKVGIGTTTPGYILTVNGQPAANGYTAFTNYSDKRLKENINNIGTGVLDKVLNLNPVSFQYNDKYFDITGYNKSTKDKVYKGFIAQELKEVFPEMVNTKEINNEEYLDTDLSSLQIYLLKAIQEQQEIINNQQKQINELKIVLEK